MATSLSTPKLTTTVSSSASFHNLLFSKKLPSLLSFPKILTSLSHLRRNSTSHPHHHLTSRRRFSIRVADSGNGADSTRHYDFDLFTFGAGSGGVRASRFAANFGASVAVCQLPFSTISSDTTGGVGGTEVFNFQCVLRGCVPKKLLVYASKFAYEFEESNGFGWRYETAPKHDWSVLIANKNAELQQLTGIYKNVLNNANVTLTEGRGQIVDPHTVDVDRKLYSARHILVSIGGRPFIPEIPGSEYAIDSDAALDLPTKPEKIAIVGGGYLLEVSPVVSRVSEYYDDFMSLDIKRD